MKNYILSISLITILFSCEQLPDINPNDNNIIVKNLSGNIYDDAIDIDDDGVVDFSSYVHDGFCSLDYTNSFNGAVNGTKTNQILAIKKTVTIGSFFEPTREIDEFKLLNYNMVVNGALIPESNWAESITLQINSNCNSLYNFPWQSNTTKYIPIRFVIADKYHYGWIEVESFVLKRVAYNSNPGLGLRVGAY